MSIVRMWDIALVCLLASACGRLGYDPTAIDGGLADDDGAPVIQGDASAVWEEFQGSGSGEGVSNAPGASSLNGRIGVGPNGKVYVLYGNEATGNKEIYLKRWSGLAWEGLGASASPGGISNDPDKSSLGGVAFDATGNPHVTWMNEGSSRSIYYRSWDGSAWLERLGSATGRGLSINANPYWPSIAVSPATGDPLVAYEVYTVLPSGGAAHLRTPAITDWQGIDGSATSEGVADPGGGAGHVSLAVEDNRIYVVWQEARMAGTDIYVSMYSPASGWQALGSSLSAGGISQSAEVSERPTIRVRSGRVMVSWTERTGAGPRAYLRSFEGGQWVELAGSASGDGVSGIYSPGQNAKFELDQQGFPFAVWSHDADGDSDIFAARWNGSSWAHPPFELGSISATNFPSDYPNVGMDPAGKIYVQWEEYLEPGRVAIYMRANL